MVPVTAAGTAAGIDGAEEQQAAVLFQAKARWLAE